VIWPRLSIDADGVESRQNGMGDNTEKRIPDSHHMHHGFDEEKEHRENCDNKVEVGNELTPDQRC